MKLTLRVTSSLKFDVYSASFPPETPAGDMVAIVVEQAADDPYFFADDRTVTNAEVLAVDGIPVAKGDWLPEVEEVAAIIHAAWMDEKLVQGVTSRKAEDGEELMVPYAQLSEKARASNRTLVRTVYAAIADAKDSD